MLQTNKRILGLDVGARTIGVAASDLTGLIAGGVETIRRTTPEGDYARLAELFAKQEAGVVVVGYPRNMNGTAGERAQACAEFAEELRLRFPGLTVVLWDERLSTAAAERVLINADLRRDKRKQVIDKLAAVLILQNYLDSRQT